jgi:hypothetical protein
LTERPYITGIPVGLFKSNRCGSHPDDGSAALVNIGSQKQRVGLSCTEVKQKSTIVSIFVMDKYVELRGI